LFFVCLIRWNVAHVPLPLFIPAGDRVSWWMRPLNAAPTRPLFSSFF
jgi:hypothetical protein